MVAVTVWIHAKNCSWEIDLVLNSAAVKPERTEPTKSSSFAAPALGTGAEASIAWIAESNNGNNSKIKIKLAMHSPYGYKP